MNDKSGRRGFLMSALGALAGLVLPMPFIRNLVAKPAAKPKDIEFEGCSIPFSAADLSRIFREHPILYGDRWIMYFIGGGMVCGPEIAIDCYTGKELDPNWQEKQEAWLKEYKESLVDNGSSCFQDRFAPGAIQVPGQSLWAQGPGSRAVRT